MRAGIGFDRDVGGGHQHGRVVYHCVLRRHAEVGHYGRITHKVIYLPVILFPAAGTGADTKVAGEDNGAVANIIVGFGLAVIVEDAVVGTLGGLFVGRAGADNRAITDAPVIVFVPVGGIGTTDITDTTFVNRFQEGFAKAVRATIPKGVGLTAVANAQQIHVVVGQAGDVAGGEGWVGVTGMAAMGGVVVKADTVTDGLDNIRGGAAGIRGRIQPDIGIDTVSDVEIVVCAIIDLTVAVRRGIGTVYAGNERDVLQIARIGHLVPFVLNGLINLGSQLRSGLGREAAVVNLREIITGKLAVPKIGDMRAGRTRKRRYLTDISDQ